MFIAIIVVVDTTLKIRSFIMYNLLNVVLATEPVPVIVFIVFCKQIVVMLNQFLTIWPICVGIG